MSIKKIKTLSGGSGTAVEVFFFFFGLDLVERAGCHAKSLLDKLFKYFITCIPRYGRSGGAWGDGDDWVGVLISSRSWSCKR